MVTAPAKLAPIPEAPVVATTPATIRLRLPAEFRLSDDQFLRLCSLNDDWLFETDPEGTLLIMTGAALPSSRRAVEIIAQLWLWLRSGVDGVVCDGPQSSSCPTAAAARPTPAGSARSGATPPAPPTTPKASGPSRPISSLKSSPTPTTPKTSSAKCRRSGWPTASASAG